MDAEADVEADPVTRCWSSASCHPGLPADAIVTADFRLLGELVAPAS